MSRRKRAMSLSSPLESPVYMVGSVMIISTIQSGASIVSHMHMPDSPDPPVELCLGGWVSSTIPMTLHTVSERVSFIVVYLMAYTISLRKV